MALIKTFVVREYGSNAPIAIDPRDVDVTTIREVPPLLTTPGIVGVQFSLFSAPGLPLRVNATEQDFRVELAAALALFATDTDDGFESYTPVLTTSGGGTALPVGPFRAIRIGTVVHVMGVFSFVPAVAGTGEDVDFSLPATLGTPVDFTTGNEAQGTATLAPSPTHAAKDGASPVSAVAPASPGVQATTHVVQSTAGTLTVGVSFSFAVKP